LSCGTRQPQHPPPNPALGGARMIINESSYPTAELERIITFAASVNTTRPITLDRIYVHVKHTRGKFSGEAWDAQPFEEWVGVEWDSGTDNDSVDYWVFLEIPHDHKFPQSRMVRGKPYGGKLSSVYTVHNWMEYVVALSAHELHHVALWQGQPRRRVEQSDEVRCERQAAYALHRFRQTEHSGLRTPVPT
jgi:hypothetical protein